MTDIIFSLNQPRAACTCLPVMCLVYDLLDMMNKNFFMTRYVVITDYKLLPLNPWTCHRACPVSVR